MHWSQCRRFSFLELTWFRSFPDEFAFAGEFDDGIWQIDNSVPPLLLKATAKHIRQRFFMKKSSAQ
jgi:site-specific DNA-cytosine methylase